MSLAKTQNRRFAHDLKIRLLLLLQIRLLSCDPEYTSALQPKIRLFSHDPKSAFSLATQNPPRLFTQNPTPCPRPGFRFFSSFQKCRPLSLTEIHFKSTSVYRKTDSSLATRTPACPLSTRKPALPTPGCRPWNCTRDSNPKVPGRLGYCTPGTRTQNPQVFWIFLKSRGDQATAPRLEP